MKYKKSVRQYKFMNSTFNHMLQAVQNTAPDGYEPTITSIADGKHGPGSLHPMPEHKAIDVRTRDYPGFNLYLNYNGTKCLIWAWIDRMRAELPRGQYDIVFDVPKHRDHIHIEYDPK